MDYIHGLQKSLDIINDIWGSKLEALAHFDDEAKRLRNKVNREEYGTVEYDTARREQLENNRKWSMAIAEVDMCQYLYNEIRKVRDTVEEVAV